MYLERRIITYPGVKPDFYEIDEEGNVFNIRNGKQISTRVDGKGYIRIQLQSTKSNGRRIEVAVHRLICWEFNGPYPDDEHNLVNHKDGIKNHNIPENLEWCSNSENVQHAINTGLLQHKRMYYYDENIISTACDLMIMGLSNMEITQYIYGGIDIHSEEHSNFVCTLAEIKCGKSYKHIYQNGMKIVDYSLYEDLDIDYIRKSLKSTASFKTDNDLINTINEYKNMGLSKLDILEKITGYRSSSATIHTRRIYAYILRSFK